MDNDLRDVEGENSPGKAESTLWGVFMVAFCLSLYFCLMLSSRKVAFPIAILLLAVLELVRVVRKYKELGMTEVAHEMAYFAVILSAFLGTYRTSMANHPAFMFTTIFYRPNFTPYGNRRLAFILSLLIAGAVLPITIGIATDSGVVDLLTVLYALLVSSLWVCCSKVGSKIFDF